MAGGQEFQKVDRTVLKAVNQELLGGSDRSAVLVAASVTDELLRRLIAANFKNSADGLLEYPGVLSSFAARIEVARAMDLITEREYENCKRLKDVRNEFAHKIDVSFTISKLDNKKLKKQLAALGSPGRKDPVSEQKFYKSSFAILAMVLMEELFRKVQRHSTYAPRTDVREKKSND